MKGRKRLIIVMIFILLFTMIFPSCDSSGEEVVIMVKYLKNDKIIDRAYYSSLYITGYSQKQDFMTSTKIFYYDYDSEVEQTVQAYYTVPNDPDFNYCWKPAPIKIYNEVDDSIVEDVSEIGRYLIIVELYPKEGDNWDYTKLLIYCTSRLRWTKIGY